MSHLFVVGAGDMTERVLHPLVAAGDVRKITLVSRSASVHELAAVLTSGYDVVVNSHEADALDTAALTTVLQASGPDAVLHTASLRSPWSMAGRTDALAAAFARAGLAVRLPLQLPVLLSTMRAVAASGWAGPVVNLSFPDVTNPLAALVGPAPLVGVGNVAIMQTRARAALRAEMGPDAALPLLRLVGQHGQLFDVVQSRLPADPADRPMVWVGDEARGDRLERRDDLPYLTAPIAPGYAYNALAAAAALPVLRAVLPGGSPLRMSVPAPNGMWGGFPMVIHGGSAVLDLPAGVSLAECEAHCWRAARGDGIDHVDSDGTVHFTDAAVEAITPFAPDLVEPLPLADIDRRATRILELLS